MIDKYWNKEKVEGRKKYDINPCPKTDRYLQKKKKTIVRGVK